MYVGLIIVFNTFENEALKNHFIASMGTLTDVKICLVSNNNNEQVFEILTEIAEQCDNTDVINTKRRKSKVSAVRAGARYMHNQYNLKYLGFIVGLKDFEIVEVIKGYIEHQETILVLNREELRSKAVKQTFFQRLFSVTQYLEKLTSNSIL
ncbi:MAG: hypothetical protein AAFX55_03270 [Bacteroidota bacterium]